MAARRNRTGGPAIRPALSGQLVNLCRRDRDTCHRRVQRGCEGVKLGARLEQIDHRPDCLCARGAAGLLIDVATNAKTVCCEWARFTMAVDVEIGGGGAAGVVKQRCGRAVKGKGKGHRYGALLSIPWEVLGRSVRTPCNDRFGRSWRLFARVSFQSLRAILSGSMPAAFHQARSSLAR